MDGTPRGPAKPIGGVFESEGQDSLLTGAVHLTGFADKTSARSSNPAR